jgi:crossover junction endodeoxyribonuclease RuvC
MLVLGIDPGTRHLGWGVVRSEGTRISHVAHGVVSPGETRPLSERLLALSDALEEVLARECPAAAAVESLFFHKDPQAAAKLGHARGVVLLCLERAAVPFAEYAPAHIKRTVAGNGAADKSQVALVVTALLQLATPPKSDAADALAIAITHARAASLPPALRAVLAAQKAPRQRARTAAAFAAAHGPATGTAGGVLVLPPALTKRSRSR